ncbi:MAG: SPOR domain-containing protein [Paludibacter sp.]|nr:SPOR domain-containing protein [Paludibacter sp.]
MEQFCIHIEKLLAHHDFVVVPGLGGFVVQSQSAQIYPDYITPPLANIGFNPSMLNSDGLLAIEISRSQQISYRMAMEYIANEITGIRHRLKTNTEVKFGNLGTLTLDESGKIQFQPIEKADFLPQNFGLNTVFTQSISNKKNQKSAKVNIEFKPARFYKFAAAILLLLGLFLSTNEVSDVRQSNNANFSSFAFLKTPEITSDSIIALVTDSTVIAEPITEEATAHFHVIVASLRDKDVAEKYCKSLLDKNFSSAKVLPPVRTYRVALRSFEDRDEAIQFMEHLRATDSRFETAWVLCD